jgi:hypothetical protein
VLVPAVLALARAAVFALAVGNFKVDFAFEQGYHVQCITNPLDATRHADESRPVILGQCPYILQEDTCSFVEFASSFFFFFFFFAYRCRIRPVEGIGWP